MTDNAVVPGPGRPQAGGPAPPYDGLPVLPGSGVRHAWDVWGRGPLPGLDPAGRTALAAGMQQVTGYTAAALAGSDEMARFLWDSGVAAVACDNPAVEWCRPTPLTAPCTGG